MKDEVSLRALLAVAAVALALAGEGALAVEQGDVAPAFRAQDFEGRTVDFPALVDGKPTVVVFWATWCNYCKAFMPYLKDIQADYGGDAINVLTINAKEDDRDSSADPAAYIDNLGFETIAVAEGDRIARAYDVEYIPGLMIVGTNGRVAWRREWTELPAGQRVAELWDGQVRDVLDRLLE